MTFVKRTAGVALALLALWLWSHLAAPRLAEAAPAPTGTVQAAPTATFQPIAPLRALPSIVVTAPAAGTTIPLNGGFLGVTYSQKNFDPSKQVRFAVELLRNGTKLGDTSSNGLLLNLATPISTVGVTAGHYYAGSADTVAPAGAGYTYRVTVYEGVWGQGQKVIAAGSSGAFTFSPPPVLAGPPQITVSAPAVAATVSIKSGYLGVTYSQKNFDPNKQVRYAVELLRNGVKLGDTSSTGLLLNLAVPVETVGVAPGHYYAGSADTVAPAGAGYTYRVTVYEGVWGQGQTVVAAGSSGAFTLAP